MRLINQYDYGLCLYFDFFSPFDLVADMSTGSVTSDGYLYQGRFQKQKFAKIVHEEIRRLLYEYPATARYLPESICQYADSSKTSEGLSLLTLHWIARLQLKTRTTLEKIQYDLNDCISRIGGQAGSILQNMAGRRYSTVAAMIEGDKLIVSLPEYEWGRAKLVFPEVHITSGEMSDIQKGLLFLMEGSYTDETGFNFSLLINQDNSDTLLDDRLLKDAGWCDVTFTAAKPYADVTCTDYAHAFVSRGYSGYSLFSACCDQLVKKARVLGHLYLGQSETRLYQFAEFWRAMGFVEDENGLATFDDNFVIELMNNRYGFEGVTVLFEELMQTPNCGELLRQAGQYADDDNINAAMTTLFKFYKYIKSLEKANKLYRFGAAAAEIFKTVAGEFPVSRGISTGFFIAKQQVIEVLEPWLSVLGFSGVFPHYRRVRGTRADYITINSGRIFTGDDGTESFSFSLEGARAHAKIKGSAPPMVGGVSYELLTANDFSLGDNPTRYAKIATAEDGGVCTVTCCGKKSSDIKITAQGLQLLPEYLKVMDSALKNKWLPRFYARYLEKNPGGHRSLGRACLTGVAVFLIYLLVMTAVFYIGDGNVELTSLSAFLSHYSTAIILGALGVTFGTIGTYFLRKNLLWQTHRMKN